MAEPYSLIVDSPEPGVLTLELSDSGGVRIGTIRERYQGPVDNLLLTSFDKIVQESKLDRSALITVTLGTGIDKDSALCRIVQSFASALGAGKKPVKR